MWARLWQHFLKDKKTIQYITSYARTVCDNDTNTWILEIWPGKWAITKHIYNVSKNFLAIEKDTSLKSIHEISPYKDMICYHDILDKNIDEILIEKGINRSSTYVIANIPYYITSPIIKRFFANAMYKVQWWLLMVQDEVWERLATATKKKSYLRWLINNAYQVDYKKTVWAKHFSPPPKVASCLIWFTLRDQQYIADKDIDTFLTVLDHIHWYKRKTLGKISKILQDKWVVIEIDISIQKKRVENMTRDDMIMILSSYSRNR